MGFFRKVKGKIEAGLLQEMAREARWMWTYVRRCRSAVFAHIGLGVLSVLLSLGSGVASKYLIDAVTGYAVGQIGTAAAFMAGMLLANIGMKYVSARMGAAIHVGVNQTIQAEVYRHILDTDWESVQGFRSGDLLQRLLGDVSTVSGGVTDFVPSLVTAGTQLLGALAIMLYYDPAMALIALLGIPAAAICSRVLVGRLRQHSKAMKELSGDMASFCEDSLSNLTGIKAFGITGGFFGKFRALQGTYRAEYLNYNRFSARTSVFLSLVSAAVSAGCFGWGVYRLWSGAISFGSMTLFLQLAGVLSGAFSTVIGLAASVISITTSAGRLMEVTQLTSEATADSRDLREETGLGLSLEGVDFAYRDGVSVLRQVDFRAEPGELIALTGPSGEGKTTLLRLLLGLIRPGAGRAVLRREGEELPISSATRSAFAYVPQGNSMMIGTIEENLRMIRPEATAEELNRVLELACADDFVRRLPGGLQYRIGGRGQGLSEGQAQRLAIARALLRKAPVLLLDEATSALDEETEARLLQNLMRSGQVRTCIFATHRPGTMARCTRRYRVEDGAVTEEEGAD